MLHACRRPPDKLQDPSEPCVDSPHKAGDTRSFALLASHGLVSCVLDCKHSVHTFRHPRHRTSAKTTGENHLARCSICTCIWITFNRWARSDMDSCECSHWCGTALDYREDVRHQTIFSRRPPGPSRTCHGTLILQRTAAVGTLILFLVRRSMPSLVTDHSSGPASRRNQISS